MNKYILKARIRDIFNPIGSETVTLNWIKRFKRLKIVVLPTIDLNYLKLCKLRSLDKSQIEYNIESLAKNGIEIEDKLLDYYLKCELHKCQQEIYKKYIIDEIIFDSTIGYDFVIKSFIDLVEIINPWNPVNPFLQVSLKYSRLYLGVLRFLGTMPISLNFYIRNFIPLSRFLGNITQTIGTLLYANIHNRWAHLIKQNKQKVHLITNSYGTLTKTNLKDVPHSVVFPWLALEINPLKFVSSQKENYAVFYGRPDPIKGINEAIKAFKLARKKGCIDKLYIIGSNLINDVNNNIFSLGWINSKEKIYTILSKASVAIYPSLSDNFSISVLETIGVGTPVVMYHNQSNYEHFSGSNLVKIVKEFDLEGLVNAICETVRNRPELDNYTINLIRTHLDWETVTNNVENAIIQAIERKK